MTKINILHCTTEQKILSLPHMYLEVGKTPLPTRVCRSAVASQLLRLLLDHVVEALAADIVLCLYMRHFTLPLLPGVLMATGSLNAGNIPVTN